MAQLSVIKWNFTGLTHTITALEGRLPLVDAMKIVKNVSEEPHFEPFKSELEDILRRNPDFGIIQNLAKVLSGDITSVEGEGPTSPYLFSKAPVATVDAECCFSKFKDRLSDERSFTEDHLKDALVIQWNSECRLE